MDRKYSRKTNRRASRRIKRKFHGNQYIEKPKKGNREKKYENRGKNQKIIKEREKSDNKETFAEENFDYGVMQYASVFAELSNQVNCVKCNGKIEFADTNFDGFAFQISLKCTACGISCINSCKRIGQEYEVNTKLLFDKKLLSTPWKGINFYLSLMDITSNFTKPCNTKAKKNIKDETTSLFNLSHYSYDFSVKSEVVESSSSDDEQQQQATISAPISNIKSWWNSKRDPGNILNNMGKNICTNTRNFTCNCQSKKILAMENKIGVKII